MQRRGLHVKWQSGLSGSSKQVKLFNLIRCGNSLCECIRIGTEAIKQLLIRKALELFQIGTISLSPLVARRNNVHATFVWPVSLGASAGPCVCRPCVALGTVLMFH